jgi:hypothetical protein
MYQLKWPESTGLNLSRMLPSVTLPPDQASLTVGFRRAATFALSRSLQDTSRNQIASRYKAAKRRRLQAVLAGYLLE